MTVAERVSSKVANEHPGLVISQLLLDLHHAFCSLSVPVRVQSPLPLFFRFFGPPFPRGFGVRSSTFSSLLLGFCRSTRGLLLVERF